MQEPMDLDLKVPKFDQKMIKILGIEEDDQISDEESMSEDDSVNNEQLDKQDIQ